MNLAIDIGNSFAKAAVFEKGQLVETFQSAKNDPDFIKPVLTAYPQIDSAIMTSSQPESESVENQLKKLMKYYIRFRPDVAVPIKNMYETPASLGSDRLAAAVGAHSTYPESDVLIVDFGTAITIDVVTKGGEFLGGNISPGATTRFRALHDYTTTLPLLSLPEETQLIGGSSAQAIEGGVVNGILFEIEGYISRLSEKYDGLRVIFTGGDGNYFAKKLKNTIFATCDLVVLGLNTILEYNAD